MQNEENERLLGDQQRNQNETQSTVKKIKYYLDPGVFLLFFGWNFSSIVLSNEILIQTCYVTFNFSYDDCIKLGRANESEEVKYIDDAIQVETLKISLINQSYKIPFSAIRSKNFDGKVDVRVSHPSSADSFVRTICRLVWKKTNHECNLFGTNDLLFLLDFPKLFV